MAILRAREAVVLIKAETTEGTDASPSAGSNAILCQNMQLNLNPEIEETNEYVGSLDGLEDIVGGLKVGMSFEAYAKGSGTPGTAPEIDPALRACGWDVVNTATAVPSSPEACGAGGSTITAELGASAGTTAQQYRGMPITIAGGAAGDSQIANYTAGKIATLADTFGSTIDAGETYQIPINNLYKPITSSIISATIWVYWAGKLFKFLAGRGNWSLMAPSGKAAKFQFQFDAMFSSHSDAAVPSTDAYQSVRPPIFKGATAKVNRIAAAISQFQLDSGTRRVFPPNPNAQEGFDAPQIMGRKMKLTLDPQAVLVATADPLADLRAGTQRIVAARWGSTAGNRIAVTVPAFQFTKVNPAERDGILIDQIEGNCVGENAGAFLCFY